MLIQILSWLSTIIMTVGATLALVVLLNVRDAIREDRHSRGRKKKRSRKQHCAS